MTTGNASCTLLLPSSRRSVSLPPPAYYAHLAAFRYRRLLSFHAARGAQDIHNIINQNLVNKPFYL